MRLLFSKQGNSVPVSEQLTSYLSELADERKIAESNQAITFNFRDTTYSAEAGGYHPVEIRIERQGGTWQFNYLTDFSYAGFPYPELVKEVDFDIANQVAFVQFIGEVSISDPDILDFYRIWESNFMTYLSTGCFDVIQITTDVE